MSSILSTPTTIVEAVTHTVTATVTVTVAPPPSMPNYSDSFFGILSDVNGVLFFASVIVAVIIGFNRMVAIPLLATFTGILSNGLGFYAWDLAGHKTIASRLAACMVADVCWQIQDVIVAFYSFFMLEKMLTGFQRRLFMSLFISLFVVVTGMRIVNTAMHVMVIIYSDGKHPDDSWYWGQTDYKVTRAYWGILAGLEVISAFFLLRVFYSAQKEAAHVGPVASRSYNLFSRLAHSSEIRVATLAGVGVTRAVCFGFYDNRYHFDRLAYVFANTFAVLLIVDLLVTRLTKFQNQSTADDTTLAYSNGSKQHTRNTLGSTTGKGAVETLQRDFPGYVGKAWDQEQAAAKVQVVPEANDEITKTEKSI